MVWVIILIVLTSLFIAWQQATFERFKEADKALDRLFKSVEKKADEDARAGKCSFRHYENLNRLLDNDEVMNRLFCQIWQPVNKILSGIDYLKEYDTGNSGENSNKTVSKNKKNILLP